MAEPLWKINTLRQQVAVLEGKKAPTIVLQNARYLHSIFKQWIEGNIWILHDRIVYAGSEFPKNTKGTEIIDCSGKTIVPGYIEPHVHPSQLYHAQSFATFAAQGGTTTIIADNLMYYITLTNEQSFTILDDLKKLPYSFYWWMRFDSQTELLNEEEVFANTQMLEWLERSDVLTGGELTSWPRVLQGDDVTLSRISMARAMHKKIEGHLPHCSESILARMKLLGVQSDHEAMTIEDVEKRILHGYAVTLRYAGGHLDLPHLLRDIVARGWQIFDHLMMTTDGSAPGFYQDGVIDKCISIAIEAGVAPIDAYLMASYNVARYYNLTELHGLIATGRFATLNILQDEFTPAPLSVLAKGVWLRKDGVNQHQLTPVKYRSIAPLQLDFELTMDDFQFSTPVGIEMLNDTRTKPYSVNMATDSPLVGTHDECYLVLVDKHGKWRMNTLLKGFATEVHGLASSYSGTGDILLIGKSASEMQFAFDEMKKLGGGIVLTENKKVVAAIPLTIGGLMYDGALEDLMQKEEVLKQALIARGYEHGEIMYTLRFLMSTHLPYIRITQKGLYDVVQQTVLLPAVMR